MMAVILIALTIAWITWGAAILGYYRKEISFLTGREQRSITTGVFFMPPAVLAYLACAKRDIHEEMESIAVLAEETARDAKAIETLRSIHEKVEKRREK